MGFKLVGYDISCTSPDSVNNFTRKIESFLIGLPENVRIQVFYRLSNSANEMIEKHKNNTTTESSAYAPIAKARYDYLESRVKNDLLYVPEIYLFIRSAALNIRKRRIFEKKERFEGYPEEAFKGHQSKFLTLAHQTKSALQSAGLNPTPLSSRECFALVFSYFNLERAGKIGIPELRDPLLPFGASLGSQLALTDIQVSKDSIKIGELYFRTVTLALLPEGETFAAMVDRLLSLPFHFWISQNIHTVQQKKEIEKLELSRRIAHSMVSGSKNVSDIESESKYAQIEDLLKELMTGSERLVSSDLNIIYWAKNNDDLERKTEEILRALRSMNQAEGLVESIALEDAFFKAAPLFCDGLRLKKMKTSNCADLMPLYSCWTGNKQPVVLLTNREGTPFAIDPFAAELPNWNGLIFGGSGAGKSFTISQLMLQFCGQSNRPKIVWIDNGASSEKLIEVMGGEFIDLNLNSGICLNMFDLENGDTKPSSSKIKLILGCLELILKDDDKIGLPKRDKGLLEEAILNCYQKTPSSIPILSDLRQILKDHPISDMRKYADILFSWTGDSAFGRMLDGQSNVKLSKDLVSIEIKGLENYRELRDIFLLLFTSYIKNEAASDLSRPYLLIVDEAQRLFKGSAMGREFAIDSFRVFRKYNAGIWCISQNYKDFLSDPELADSLMPNTTFVFILRQRKIDWDDFKRTFDFNDAQVEAVKSLEIVKGKYSEFFLMQDENQGVVRLEPEPLSYWICTTDGNEKSLIADLRAQNPSRPLIDILIELSKGVSCEKSEIKVA